MENNSATLIRSKLLSVGHCLPQKKIANDGFSHLNTSDEWITTRTGIKYRHFVTENQTTTDIAIIAVVEALQKAELKANDIDLIICATTTPEKTFPSTACLIQGRIEAEKAVAFDIQAVCSGFLFGIDIVHKYSQFDCYKRIMLIGADTFSNILNMQDRSTCILFGDGAGCAIFSSHPDDIKKYKLSQENGIINCSIKSNGKYASWLCTDDGVSTNKSAGKVTMKGSEIYKFALNKMPPMLNEFLQKNNTSFEEIDFFIAHQANSRIIKAMAEKLEIPTDKVIITVDKHANTSAASIPLAMYEGIKSKKIKKGKLILLQALGGGLTWGAALLRA